MACKATAKSILVILLSLHLVSCMDKTAVVSQEKFFSLQTGATELQMRDQCGPPVNTYYLENGDVEYEYIENIYMNEAYLNDGLQIRNHYIFVARNGIIISKRTFSERSPAYQDNIESPNLY